MKAGKVKDIRFSYNSDTKIVLNMLMLGEDPAGGVYLLLCVYFLYCIILYKLYYMKTARFCAFVLQIMLHVILLYTAQAKNKNVNM